MNAQRLLLAALIVSGLSTAAHASVVVSDVVTDRAGFTAPAPAMVVAPEALPQRYRNETVQLSLTVDASGRPQNIALARGNDPHLARRLIPAVAQWQFKPALRNGVPVSAKVVLPLHLVDAAGS